MFPPECDPFTAPIKAMAKTPTEFYVDDLKVSHPKPDTVVANLLTNEVFSLEINGLVYNSYSAVLLENLYYKPAYANRISLDDYNHQGVAILEGHGYAFQMDDQYGYSIEVDAKFDKGALVPYAIKFKTGYTKNPQYEQTEEGKVCAMGL